MLVTALVASSVSFRLAHSFVCINSTSITIMKKYCRRKRQSYNLVLLFHALVYFIGFKKPSLCITATFSLNSHCLLHFPLPILKSGEITLNEWQYIKLFTGNPLVFVLMSECNLRSHTSPDRDMLHPLIAIRCQINVTYHPT